MTAITIRHITFKVWLFLLADFLCIFTLIKLIPASLHDYGRYEECIGTRNLQVHQSYYFQQNASSSTWLNDPNDLRIFWEIDI